MRVHAFVEDRFVPADGFVENICGVVLIVSPHHRQAVAEALTSWPGVEVHAAEGSKMVLTVEDTPDISAERIMAQLQDLDHVYAVSLVYHHFDSNSGKETAP